MDRTDRKLIALICICLSIGGIANGISDFGRTKAINELAEKQAILAEKVDALTHLSFPLKKSLYGANRGRTEAYSEPLDEQTEDELLPQEPEWFTVQATAYCGCSQCCGKWAEIAPCATASGWGAQEGLTIAADEMYQFGTRFYIEGLGERVVMDRGSAIHDNHIDVYFENHSDACAFGMKYLQAYIIETPEN